MTFEVGNFAVKKQPSFMAKFSYPYNDLVVCKSSTNYLPFTIQMTRYLYTTEMFRLR